MGILEDLKHKVEKLGDKAREGFDDARDKAGDLLDDAKDRIGHHDDGAPLGESTDVGPDTSSTDAVQPGYVAAEDDVTEASDESSLDEVADEDEDAADATDSAEVGEAELDGDGVQALVDPVVDEESFVAEPAAAPGTTAPAAAELDAEELVETDVDPYDEPLTETIGDEIASAAVDSEAVAEAVEPTGRDPQA